MVSPPVEGEEPDAEKINDLMNNIEKYTLASHLIWGLWGIISVRSLAQSLSQVLDGEQEHHVHPILTVLASCVQEHVNDIDFDYMEYARQRFTQYWLKKPAIITCHADE
jgi:choline/ethanolamine kinase